MTRARDRHGWHVLVVVGDSDMLRHCEIVRESTGGDLGMVGSGKVGIMSCCKCFNARSQSGSVRQYCG